MLERARIGRIASRLLGSPEAGELKARFDTMSAPEAAEWVRANLDDLEARFAS